jgi:hypothetical protein
MATATVNERINTFARRLTAWEFIQRRLFRAPFQRVTTIAVTALAALTIASAAETQEFNRRATATAQVMAGITPTTGDPAINRLTRLDCFVEHQKWMAAQWNQVRDRISTIENWRSRQIRMPAAHNRTLLYPFSGPDFLNAYALFPDHPQYIFFSLERPGALPDLDSVQASQFGKLLEDVRGAFRDIFQRNYFITDYMSKQLTTPWIRGTVPVMATMMALLNQRIVRIEPLDLFPELTRAYESSAAAKHPRRLMRAARIEYVGPNGGAVRQVDYVSVDATDKALESYPDFTPWLARRRPATVLLKSASYLLHDNQFDKTRSMILATADMVVQDDTGIPYRFLNQPPWQVRLYGQYQKPIKSLRYGYQPDLESAFKSTGTPAELPFPFGYHWRGKQSGLLVANR